MLSAAVLGNKISLQFIYNKQISWKPLEAIQLFFFKPLHILVLKKHDPVINKRADEALHGKMECRVIVFNCTEMLLDLDLGIELLAYLPYDRILSGFPCFKLATREFPLVLVITITSFSCKDETILDYYCRSDRYTLHALRIHPSRDLLQVMGLSHEKGGSQSKDYHQVCMTKYMSYKKTPLRTKGGKPLGGEQKEVRLRAYVSSLQPRSNITELESYGNTLFKFFSN